MYFIDVIRGKNITFVYHKILYNMKEEELIEQMKNGNNIAFAALYDYYCQKVYNFTKLYVTSSDTVAEIVQDVSRNFEQLKRVQVVYEPKKYDLEQFRQFLLERKQEVKSLLAVVNKVLPGISFLIKPAAGCAKICSK